TGNASTAANVNNASAASSSNNREPATDEQLDHYVRALGFGVPRIQVLAVGRVLAEGERGMRFAIERYDELSDGGQQLTVALAGRQISPVAAGFLARVLCDRSSTAVLRTIADEALRSQSPEVLRELVA